MIIRLPAILLAVVCCVCATTGYTQNLTVDSLRQQIGQAESDSQKVNLTLQLVDELVALNQPKEVREEIGNILRLSTLVGYQEGYLRGLLKMGDHYISRQVPDSALVPIREGLSQTNEPHFRLQFLSQRGTVSRLDGNPVESIRYYNQAMILADSLDSTGGKARINYNLSVSQRMIGDYASAFENLYRSLMQAEQVRDSSLKALILNDIGELYNELNDPVEAIYYLENSQRISREYNLTSTLIRTLMNLGIVHTGFENYETAARYFSEAKELAEELNDLFRRVIIDYNLGHLDLRQQNYNSARNYFSSALELSRERNLQDGIYYNTIGMGELYRDLGRYGQALDWFRQAHDLSRSMNSGPRISQSLEELYETHKRSGQISRALDALESLKLHTDSIRTIERERSRAEFEALLEARRQEEENRLLLARQAEQDARIQLQQGLGAGSLVVLAVVLGVTLFLYRNVRTREKMNRELKERNDEISSKNEELDRLNNIKNKMFAVVAHDLRGPLSSLQSLLYLLREHDLSKDELDEITNSLEQSLHDNATTMENLLAWAKSQMAGIKINYRVFKLRAGAEAVYSQIKFQAEQKKIAITIDIDPDLEIYADYDMIKLIIRNILSNAVKFCQADDKIDIEAMQSGGFTTIKIRDTGTGIRKEDQEKIFDDEHFSKKGTKNEQGSGLGLTLCREFIEKHGGEIWFESEFGKGTEFSFTIPVEADSDGGETGDNKVASGISDKSFTSH
jgi:two-component system, sensor histidine kinase and response regulator